MENENITLEQLAEFYRFLQGECPDTIHMKNGYQPKMTAKKAFTVIWYLQEHLRIFPDHIEKCDNCDSLFDAHGEGIHWETKGKDYCGSCEYLVPINYDRGKK